MSNWYDNIVSSIVIALEAVFVKKNNLKTINNNSLIGQGNITIQGGSSGGGSYIHDYYSDSTNKKIVLDYSNGVTNADIVTDWSSPLSDERVPSEKLVKTALDSISGGGGGSSVTVDSTWVSNSTNPVQSQLIKSALDLKSDTGHTHSQYLTEHQSLTNYVQKNNTAGLLKNDGTVMTSGTGSTNFALGNHTHSAYVNPTIVDNLTTDSSSQVLSAKQGKVLKDYVDTLVGNIEEDMLS